jgi:hypothetical protein
VVEFLPSKQGVAGSSPVSRSIGFKIAESVVETIAGNNRRYLTFFGSNKLRIRQTSTQLIASPDYQSLVRECPRSKYLTFYQCPKASSRHKDRPVCHAIPAGSEKPASAQPQPDA